MLNRLRQAVAGVLAKVLIALLVVSFALWGIGDVFGRDTDPIIVEVGGETISVSEYQRFFQIGLAQISRRQGRDISVEQARRTGLDGQILSQMISDAVLVQSAENIGLTVSEEEIIKRIQETESFQGPFGGFDRVNFENSLRSIGITEEEYIQQRRRELIRDQFMTMFLRTPPPPNDFVEAVYETRQEERVAEYVILKPDQVDEPKKPKKEDLEKFIKQRSYLFMEPERRDFVVLLLEAKKIAATVKIDEEALRGEYRRQLSGLTVPEERKIHQISFSSEKAAMSARKRIKTGASFLRLAKRKKLSKEDTDLGWFKQGDYISPEIEEAVLVLDEGKISQPLEGPLGWVLIYVEKIKPAKKKSFEEVRQSLRDQLAFNLEQDEIDIILDLVEDEIASGESFEVIAKKFPLKLVKEAISRDDSLPEGLKDIDGLKQAIFKADIGNPLPAEQTSKGDVYWLIIDKITFRKQQEFEQAKEKATERWIKSEKEKELQKIANEIRREGNKGKEFKELTKVKIERTGSLGREGSSKILTSRLMDSLFRTKEGRFFSGKGRDRDHIIVARVASVKQKGVKVREEEREKRVLVENIGKDNGDELLIQYINAAREDLDLRFYEENFELVFEPNRSFNQSGLMLR